MTFESHRGRHAVHAEEHAGKTDSPALPHHEGGSLRVERKTKTHPNGVWFHDPYERPPQPHHIHLAPCPAACEVEHAHVPVCTDHQVDACPQEHWVGGHPDPSWPHHVEFDGSTGLWGYTRCTEEEVADNALADAHFAEIEETKAKKIREEAEARLRTMQARAEDDPAFAALLEHLGVQLPAAPDGN